MNKYTCDIMNFSDRIIRPPFEARSIFLQVTSGCSHNSCKFCDYYKNTSFKISSEEEVIIDLKELHDRKVAHNRVWLLSADPFGLDYERLCSIAELIGKHLPYVNSIGCYARVDSLKDKSIRQLKELKKLGYESIVFGVESCDDKLLDYMNKGYCSDDVIEQIRKMDEANMGYTFTFLNGMGGHDYGLNHAIQTAKVFNKMNPERIMINRLTIRENTPLYSKVENNIFEMPTEKECIRELMTFIDKLEIDTFIDATNNTNIIPFFGKTTNKENILDKLNDEIKRFK